MVDGKSDSSVSVGMSSFKLAASNLVDSLFRHKLGEAEPACVATAVSEIRS